MSLKYPDTLEANNTSASGYPIVKGTQVAGWHSVADLDELYQVYDYLISPSGTNENSDAIGFKVYVRSENSSYKLIDWDKRHEEGGWEQSDGLSPEDAKKFEEIKGLWEAGKNDYTANRIVKVKSGDEEVDNFANAYGVGSTNESYMFDTESLRPYFVITSEAESNTAKLISTDGSYYTDYHAFTQAVSSHVNVFSGIHLYNEDEDIDVEISGVSEVTESDGTTSYIFNFYPDTYITKEGLSSSKVYVRTGAFGRYSHAEGYKTTANNGSHAEGDSNMAIGADSHTEGSSNKSIGIYSHTEGLTNAAIGAASHAEGNLTHAMGSYSHAEGAAAIAYSYASHAEGVAAIAYEYASHAEGGDNLARGAFSHVEGAGNSHSFTPISLSKVKTDGAGYSYYIMDYTSSSGAPLFNVQYDTNGYVTDGNMSSGAPIDFIELSYYSGNYSSFISNLRESSYVSISNGDVKIPDKINTSKLGAYSIVREGFGNPGSPYKYYLKSDKSDLAGTLGYFLGGTESIGGHVEGAGNMDVCMSYESHVEGSGNLSVNSSWSHIEGAGNKSIGSYLHVEGSGNMASGSFSHVEGAGQIVLSAYAHIEGAGNRMEGAEFSHVEGCGNYTASTYTHIEGSGNGIDRNAAHNVHIEGADNIIAKTKDNKYGYVSLSHIEGAANTLANGNFTHVHVEGVAHMLTPKATGYTVNGSHFEGTNQHIYPDQGSVNYAHLEGASNTIGSSAQMHIEGSANTANTLQHSSINQNSHIEGAGNSMTGAVSNSHIEGSSNVMYSVNDAHIEGTGNLINSWSYNSHAEGAKNTIMSYSYGAHLEGEYHTVRMSAGAHVEGSGHVPFQVYSVNTKSNGTKEYVIIPYNFDSFENIINNYGAGYDIANSVYQAIDSGCIFTKNDLRYYVEDTYDSNFIVKSAAFSKSPLSYRVTFYGDVDIAKDDIIYLYTLTEGMNVHAEGFGTSAYGNFSHAEGLNNYLKSKSGHIEGEFNKVNPSVSVANPNAAVLHVEGRLNTVAGVNIKESHIEGSGNSVVNSYLSHIEGCSNVVTTEDLYDVKCLHVEGIGNTVSLTESGISHVEGGNNKLTGKGYYTHIEGNFNESDNYESHVEGEHNKQISVLSPTYKWFYGYINHSEGLQNTMTACDMSHIEGQNNSISYQKFTHVEGLYNTMYTPENSEYNSNQQCNHVEGMYNTLDPRFELYDITITPGAYNFGDIKNQENPAGAFRYMNKNHIEGNYNYFISSGKRGYGYYPDEIQLNHVEGYKNKLDGNLNHIEGSCHVVVGNSAHIEGHGNGLITNDSQYNHIEGMNNYINVPAAGQDKVNHVEGAQNKITSSVAQFNHISGFSNTITGNNIYGEFNTIEGSNNTIGYTSTSAAEYTGDMNMKYVHIEGYGNRNIGYYYQYSEMNHLEGYGNTIQDDSKSHIQGFNNTITNNKAYQYGGCNNIGGYSNSMDSSFCNTIYGQSNNIGSYCNTNDVGGHNNQVSCTITQEYNSYSKKYEDRYTQTNMNIVRGENNIVKDGSFNAVFGYHDYVYGTGSLITIGAQGYNNIYGSYNFLHGMTGGRTFRGNYSSVISSWESYFTGTNDAYSDYAFIASSSGSYITNGKFNSILTASGSYLYNTQHSTILGAISSYMYDETSPSSGVGTELNAIVGGVNHNFYSNVRLSAAIGGCGNSIHNNVESGLIAGGQSNYISGDNLSGGKLYRSAILGGYNNGIEASYSAIIAGNTNKIRPYSEGSVILGGYGNYVSDESFNAFIAGSDLSTIYTGSDYDVILSSVNSNVSGEFNIVASSYNSSLSGDDSFHSYTSGCNLFSGNVMFSKTEGFGNVSLTIKVAPDGEAEKYEGSYVYYVDSTSTGYNLGMAASDLDKLATILKLGVKINQQSTSPTNNNKGDISVVDCYFDDDTDRLYLVVDTELVTSRNVFVSGGYNMGNFSSVFGAFNNNSADFSHVEGLWNINEGKMSTISGTDNYNTGENSHIIGGKGNSNIDHKNVAIIACEGITETEDNTVYLPNVKITGKINIDGSDMSPITEEALAEILNNIVA